MEAWPNFSNIPEYQTLRKFVLRFTRCYIHTDRVKLNRHTFATFGSEHAKNGLIFLSGTLKTQIKLQ
jgi:hypothetical protein